MNAAGDPLAVCMCVCEWEKTSWLLPSFQVGTSYCITFSAQPCTSSKAAKGATACPVRRVGS